MSSLRKILLISLFVLSGLMFLYAQNPVLNQTPKETTRILFVLDASQSMLGKWQSDLKINIARRLLVKMLDSLAQLPDLQLGLRVYGHQYQFPPQVCTDTKLEVPFADNNLGSIKEVLNRLKPKGTTPIAYSLMESANDFTPCDNCRNIIVLITDGLEECGGDPCDVSLTLQKKGIFLKPFVIGIGNNDMSRAFECVGTYLDASTEENFRTALNVVIRKALNKTTAQVNILDAYGNPNETNVAMSLIDHRTGRIVSNYIHTLNHKGVPDTISLDPLKSYDLLIHTVPPVRADSISIYQGIHNYLPAEGATGYLQVREQGGKDYFKESITCLVRQKGKAHILNVQDIMDVERYRTGFYDIEVLCYPRLIIENVQIKQSHTTSVDIPNPGYAAIRFTAGGYGALFQMDGKELNWVKNLDRKKAGTDLLVLLPGHYKIVWRSIYAHRVLYTFESNFEILSGRTTGVETSLGR